MPRRARGEGTITYHEPSGLYMAQVSVGRRPDGRRDRRTVYGRTPEEVADKLLELRRQLKDGTLPQPHRYTVQEWAEQWLRDVCRLRGKRKEGLAENTLEVYQNGLRYITDAYGTLLLKELTGQHLTDLYVRMREKGLSLRQCEIVHNVAGMMLRAAVKARLIPRDVSEDVSYVPKAVYDDEPRALTPEEFEALLAEAAKMRGTRGRWVAAFRLAVDAALGRGELLGVQWGDLDLRDGMLHVRRQVLRQKGGALVTGPLKTKARRRTVPISDATIAALKEWQRTIRQATGLDILPANAYVCCWYHRGRYKVDEPTSPEALNDAFRVCCERAGIEDATFHTLRATTATWLAEAGVPIKTAMAITGHSRPETLIKYYVRVTESSKREAAKKLADFLAPKSRLDKALQEEVE